MDSATHNRRETDSFGHRTKVLAEVIGCWIVICGLIVAVVRMYVRTSDLIDAAPRTEDRLKAMETAKAISDLQFKTNDDRWVRVERWMDRIERKLDRRGP